MADTRRYSDEELQGFKTLILDKLEKAQKDYEMYKHSVVRGEENGDNDTTPTFKTIEDAIFSLSKEEAGKLAQRQAKFIQYLQASLFRIGNKTYGICVDCKNLIQRERLFSVPHASQCFDCKNPEGNSPCIYAYARE